jgi:hypothetical protein
MPSHVDRCRGAPLFSQCVGPGPSLLPPLAARGCLDGWSSGGLRTQPDEHAFAIVDACEIPHAPRGRALNATT